MPVIRRSLLLVLVTVLATGCASGGAAFAPIAEQDRGVVVFVPGITGSKLIDGDSGRVLWGDFRSLFLPKDDGHRTAMPIGGAKDTIVPGDPILRVGTLPTLRRDIYLPIIEAFESAGYRRGDDLILFGYDWRSDSIANGRLLARKLDAIAAGDRKGRPIHLVCQSNAAYLCRWALRYGDVSLDDAEAGLTARPRARVASMSMLATASGGGIRILREIDRGRRYIKGIGRHLRPETFFTYEALYQDLPTGRDDLFVDENGRRLDIDLFDAKSWKSYGWAIFGDEPAKRAARAPEIFGDEAARLAVLQRFLDRATRMHAALESDAAPWPEATKLVSIQGKSFPTMSRAVVMRDGERWKTLFLGDRELEGRLALEGLLAEEGDVHASVRSQQTLAPSELRAIGGATHYLPGDHLTIAHRPETLKILVDATR